MNVLVILALILEIKVNEFCICGIDGFKRKKRPSEKRKRKLQTPNKKRTGKLESLIRKRIGQRKVMLSNWFLFKRFYARESF